MVVELNFLNVFAQIHNALLNNNSVNLVIKADQSHKK